MTARTHLASLAELREHLANGIASDATSSVDARSIYFNANCEGLGVLELRWLEGERLVEIAAPLAIDTSHLDRRDVALAVAEVNVRLEIFGVELTDELRFASRLFWNQDDAVAATSIDAVIEGARVASSRLGLVLAQAAPSKESL